MVIAKNTTKQWFKNKLKPTQAQFWAWMDSYWHKDEKIPVSSISGLEKLLNSVATVGQIEAILESVPTTRTGLMNGDKIELTAHESVKYVLPAGAKLYAIEFVSKGFLKIGTASDSEDIGDMNGSVGDILNMGLLSVVEVWLTGSEDMAIEPIIYVK